MNKINWRLVFSWCVYTSTTLATLVSWLLEGPAITWLTASLVALILVRVEAMVQLYNANFYAVQDDDDEGV